MVSQYAQAGSPYLQASEIELGMIARCAIRNERYDQRQVERFPMFRELTESAILGTFSWLLMGSRMRLLFAPTVMNFAGYTCTPGDIARDYLHVKYPRKLRARTAQLEACRRPRHAPLYAVPSEIPSAVYIDIKAAYWQILRIIGWDCDYHPSEFLGKESNVDDFPFPGHKLARNCLVTAALVTPVQMWHYETQKVIERKMGNDLCNLVMWACVHDILNSIAGDCVSAGAMYVHTDGFICSERNAASVATAIAEWGLSCDIRKRGNARIYGVGSYDIDTHKAKRPYPKPHVVDKIDRLPYATWLKRSVRHFADHTEPYQG